MSGPPAPPRSTSGDPSRWGTRRAIAAASIGNAFEWYDFTVYALFAVYIAKAFFPGGGSTTELVKAFLAFGVGFVVRPLGAILLGIYGDRAGRKAVLTLTIGIMVAGTVVLAFAPTYAAIGVGAPLMILTGRALQGFSAGGEVGGAAAFLIEHAPERRRGEFASWLQASMALSNIMGALLGFATTSLFTVEQIGAFAWRIPFLFGLLIAPIGLWMRRTLTETPYFLEQGAAAGPRLQPLRTLVAEFPLTMARGVGMSVLWTVSTYVLIIFMPVYVQRTFHYSASDAFRAALVGNLFLAASCVAGGALSDRFGRRTVMLTATVLLGVGVHPMFWLLGASPGHGPLMLVQTLFCIATGLFAGVVPAALSESFPTRVRSIGTSLSYNVAVMVFSGFAPAVLTWIGARGGGAAAPAWYVTFAAVLAAPAVLGWKPHALSENSSPGPIPN